MKNIIIIALVLVVIAYLYITYGGGTTTSSKASGTGATNTPQFSRSNIAQLSAGIKGINGNTLLAHFKQLTQAQPKYGTLDITKIATTTKPNVKPVPPADITICTAVPAQPANSLTGTPAIPEHWTSKAAYYFKGTPPAMLSFLKNYKGYKLKEMNGSQWTQMVKPLPDVLTDGVLTLTVTQSKINSLSSPGAYFMAPTDFKISENATGKVVCTGKWFAVGHSPANTFTYELSLLSNIVPIMNLSAIPIMTEKEYLTFLKDQDKTKPVNQYYGVTKPTSSAALNQHTNTNASIQ